MSKWLVSLFILGVLVGCDLIDDNTPSQSESESAGVKFTPFSIDDYDKLESSQSLEGTWVGISNYSKEVGIHNNEGDFKNFYEYSEKNIFLILSAAPGYHAMYTSCTDGGTSSISIGSAGNSVRYGDSYIPELAIINNNEMNGTTQYGGKEWQFKKISDNTEGIGRVLSHWSNSERANSSKTMSSFCEKIEKANLYDSAGVRIYHDYTFGAVSSIENAVTSGAEFQVAKLSLNQTTENRNIVDIRTDSAARYWITQSSQDNINIDFTLSENTDFSVKVIGTDIGSGESIDLDMQVQL